MSRDSWNSFAWHLDRHTICARHLNKILSAIKKHFWARTRIALTALRKTKTKTKRNEPNQTKPNQHRYSSIVRAVEQWSSGAATSTSAPAAGAHHQLPIRSHYIKIIVGRTESVKFKPNTTTKKYIALGAHYFVICAPAAPLLAWGRGCLNDASRA